MPVDSKKQILKTVKQRSYLNRDFDGFRADLLEYAKIHFKDQIRDFSEASLGGLLLELPAYVGDVMSFYLDHQFQELDPETAIETKNIEKALKASGVAVVGASPAVVSEEFIIKVPALLVNGVYQPDHTALPVILPQTIISADNGVLFELIEELDYSSVDKNGTLKASKLAIDANNDGIPEHFFLTLNGTCISGFTATESFSISSFQAFRKLALANDNVTEIKNVYDANGNTYYRVEYLTQNTVFRPLPNFNEDNDLVEFAMQILPAPYRFTVDASLQSGKTSLTFGGGTAETLDDDIVPDPSEFAIPLFGKASIPRVSLDPNTLLQTSTLGVIPTNTVITVQYRYGGGLKHNVAAGSLRSISTLIMQFPQSPLPAVAALVRQSVTAINRENASGGEDAPTIDELKSKIPASRSAQSRIVTKEDLLARVYTMPSNFGRVFRAGIRPNPINPLASQLFIISRDSNSSLIISPDTLKKNLKTYLNQYRMISDAIDILDANVINLTVEFKIVVDPQFNKHLVLQTVIGRLKQYFNIKNFEIDQPIILSDLTNIVFNNQGVISVEDLKVKNIIGSVGTRSYSNTQFDTKINTRKGLIIGPPGSIFEVRYSDYDIIGNAN